MRASAFRSAASRAALLLAGTVLAGTALAGTALAGTALADPTRPPATMTMSTAAPAGVTRPVLAVASAPATAPVPPPVLQSVQLPARGPAVAMIDGRLVKAGDLVGKRTVLAIDSQGLVLSGDTGQQRLWLIDGNPKQAPGSITTARTTSFVPAPQALDPSLVLDPPARSGVAPPQPTGVGALSLAGRTQP